MFCAYEQKIGRIFIYKIMKTLTEYDSCIIGNLRCSVQKSSMGFFLSTSSNPNVVIISQFGLNARIIREKLGLSVGDVNEQGSFPYCNSLETLTKVTNYLMSLGNPNSYKKIAVAFDINGTIDKDSFDYCPKNDEGKVSFKENALIGRYIEWLVDVPDKNARKGDLHQIFKNETSWIYGPLNSILFVDRIPNGDILIHAKNFDIKAHRAANYPRKNDIVTLEHDEKTVPKFIVPLEDTSISKDTLDTLKTSKQEESIISRSQKMEEIYVKRRTLL